MCPIYGSDLISTYVFGVSVSFSGSLFSLLLEIVLTSLPKDWPYYKGRLTINSLSYYFLKGGSLSLETDILSKGRYFGLYICRGYDFFIIELVIDEEKTLLMTGRWGSSLGLGFIVTGMKGGSWL